MTFHAFLLVRNEADILPQTLPHLLEFCAAVHVLDTGSTDGTWDLVREMALREKRLRPFASAPLTGDVSLRGIMFEAVRRTMRGGDWFGRVDADEFYHHQLVGLRVVTSEDEDLGTVREVLATGGNAVLVVSGSRGEVLLPFIDEVVRLVDVVAGSIAVDLIDGLIPERRERQPRVPPRRWRAGRKN